MIIYDRNVMTMTNELSQFTSYHPKKNNDASQSIRLLMMLKCWSVPSTSDFKPPGVPGLHPLPWDAHRSRTPGPWVDRNTRDFCWAQAAPKHPCWGDETFHVRTQNPHFSLVKPLNHLKSLDSMFHPHPRFAGEVPTPMIYGCPKKW